MNFEVLIPGDYKEIVPQAQNAFAQFETWLSGAFVTLVDATTVTWAYDGAQSLNATLTPAGNRQLAITGAENGADGTIFIDNSGGLASSIILPINSLLENSTGGLTISLPVAECALSFVYDGTNFRWMVPLSPGSGGLGDVSSSAVTAVDGEAAVFDGTSGKLIRRAIGSGVAKLTSGVLGIATGGTDYLAPVMTTLGDIEYGGASGVLTRLAGNTSSTRKFLSSTGSFGAATAPVWNQPASSDLSDASNIPLLNGAPNTFSGTNVFQNIGIHGTSTSTLKFINLAQTSLTGLIAAGSIYGAYVDIGTPEASSFNSVIGGMFQATSTFPSGLPDHANVIGVQAHAYYQPTATGGRCDSLVGVESVVANSTSSSTNYTQNAYGHYVQIQNTGGGAISSGYGVYVDVMSNSTSYWNTDAQLFYGKYRHLGSGAVAVAVYGLRFDSWAKGSGTVANSYGIYMDSTVDLGATNSWAIWSGATCPSLLSGSFQTTALGVGTSAPAAGIDTLTSVASTGGGVTARNTDSTGWGMLDLRSDSVQFRLSANGSATANSSLTTALSTGVIWTSSVGGINIVSSNASASIVIGTGGFNSPRLTIGPSGAVSMTGDLTVSGLLKAGSGPTTHTDAAGKILTTALNTVAVAQGGTGAVTLASNGVLYGNGTSAVQALAVNSTATTKFLSQVSSGTPAWGQPAFSDLTGTITVAQGGTGITSYAVGDLIYASGTTTLSELADVAAGSYLRSGGVTTAPVWSTTTLPNSATVGDLLYASATNVYSNLADVATGNALISGGVATAMSWGKVGLTTHVSGTLAVGNGGTGIASFTVGDILYASATTTLSALADVAAGSYLRSGGVTTAPLWSTLILPNAVTLGSVVFGSATNTYGQDNANFFWDLTNHRLGIITPAPSFPLDVAGVIGTTSIRYRDDTGTLLIGKSYRTQIQTNNANTVVFDAGVNQSTVISPYSASYYILLSGGNVGIGASTPSQLLDVAGNIIISAATANLYLKDSSTGWQSSSTTVVTPQANNSVRSTSYTSGLVGWNISATGNLEANNIDVRGAIHAGIFVYNALQVTAGTQIITPSGGKLRTDVTITASPTYTSTTFTIEIVDQDGLSHAASQLFAVNDIIELKDGLIGTTWFKVTAVSDQTTFWRYTASIQAGTANVTYRAGLGVPDYKTSGYGFIVLTADQTNAPFMQMATHAGTFSSADASGTLVVTPRLRVGNLNGSYGYSSDVYGFGTGQYGTANQPWLTVDSTSGLRIGGGSGGTTQLAQWDTSGNILIGQASTASQSSLLITSGRIDLRNGGSNTVMIRLAADGSGYLANTAIAWDTAGNLTMTGNAVIGGVTIGSGKMYIGTGTYNNANTAFYVDSTGQFSLKDKLVWSGSALTISGAITATTGTIGSFTIGTYLNSGSKATYNDGVAGVHIGSDGIGLGAAFSVSAAGALTSTSGSIGGWTITTDSLAKDTGVAATSAGLYPADMPFFAGATVAGRGSAPFRVSPAGALFASSATITGTITSTAGTIGGWTINSTTLTGGSATLDSAGKLTLGTTTNVVILDAADATYRLVVGDSTYASAPFRVTKAGAVTATNATITGTVTATAGAIGGWTITSTRIASTHVFIDDAGEYISMGTTPPTSYGSNVGLFLEGANSGRLSLYKDANNYLQWDNSKLLIKAANFTVDSSGNLTASSATLSGAITATSGSITGTLAISGSGAIGIGATSVSTGTGLWLNTAGITGLLSGVVQAKFDASTGTVTAAAGNVVLDVNGLSFKSLDPSAYLGNASLKFYNSTDRVADLWASGSAGAGAQIVCSSRNSNGATAQLKGENIAGTNGSSVTVAYNDASGVGSARIFVGGSSTAGITGGTFSGLVVGGSGLSPAAMLDVRGNAILIATIGGTSTDGLIVTNTTAAAAGAQQWSSRIRLTGQGWRTSFGGLSQTFDWILENQTVQGAANASSNLVISSQVAGGGYVVQSTLSSAGDLTITGLLKVGSGPTTHTDAAGKILTAALNTVGVAQGGTANTTFTAYAVICAGTTSTGAFQNVSGVGTSGQVLTSNGASALPTWQTISGASAPLALVGSSNVVQFSVKDYSTQATDSLFKLLKNDGNRLFTFGNDGNLARRAQLRLYGTDDGAGNYERLTIFHPGDNNDDIQFQSQAGGTGVVRNMTFTSPTTRFSGALRTSSLMVKSAPGASQWISFHEENVSDNGSMGFATGGTDMGIYIGGNGNFASGTNIMNLKSTGVVQMPHYGAGTATFDASGNISSVSDERFKTNIQPFRYGLSEILAVNPITHGWNYASGLETEHQYSGFSAQNVLEAMHLHVVHTKDGVLHNPLMGVVCALVNSVKELNAQLAEQSALIERLQKAA